MTGGRDEVIAPAGPRATGTAAGPEIDLVPRQRRAEQPAATRPTPQLRHVSEPATVRIGKAQLMCIDLAEAVDRVLDLADRERPGFVVTANADHIVRMAREPELAEAYSRAEIAVLDGQPLVWTARAITGGPVHRVTGVDLFEELCRRGTDDVRLYMLGGSEANSARAAQVLRARHPGISIVGRDTGALDEDTTEAVIGRVRASGANVVALFLGCPKQELWVSRHLESLPPAAYLCLGGTVDIVSGALPRAGHVWQRLGLEWLHRLLLEPRRLWRRYLLDDPRFALIAARSIRRSRITTNNQYSISD